MVPSGKGEDVSGTSTITSKPICGESEGEDVGGVRVVDVNVGHGCELFIYTKREEEVS